MSFSMVVVRVVFGTAPITVSSLSPCSVRSCCFTWTFCQKQLIPLKMPFVFLHHQNHLKVTEFQQAGVVSASKSVKLQTLSKVLILHLMRFSYGSAGSSKLHKPVRFHPEIILGRELLVSPTAEGQRYELVATVSHHGRDPSKGHYTADTKHSDGQWLRFDDATVSEVGLP